MPLYRAKITVAANLRYEREVHEREIRAPYRERAVWLARQWAKDTHYRRAFDGIHDVSVELEELPE